MSSIKTKFGRRLKELRKNRGFTQEQLSELVSIEPTNLSKIESGIHFPQPEKLEKIAQALNVNIAELFEFEHLQDKNMLLDCITSSLSKLDEKKVEFVYKIITGLKIFK